MGQEKIYARCSVDGCESKYYKGKYCPKHRSRLRRTGSLDGGQSNAEWLSNAIAFANETDCIDWPFAKTSGYGVVFYMGEQMTAHRASLIITHGVNKKDMAAIHGPCHNKSCVNPFHLSWGTQKQNMADKLRDGTHLRGSDCGSAKLTEKDVLLIRELAASIPYSKIACDFGISEKYVSCVVTKRTWSWVS
jgi:hypothetical protein